MSGSSKPQSVFFPELLRRTLLACFDEPQTSSDGGAVLVRAADRRLGLVDRLAGCLLEWRQAGKVVHPIVDLLKQRIYGIACGYEDGNDAARLADDPVHKLLLDRDPVNGPPLGSAPTLCRLENAVTRTELYRCAEVLCDTVIEHHRHRLRGRARLITIDLDIIKDETHGTQQLSFFNGFYDSWCYLPLVGTLRFDQEEDLYALAAVLRPGNAPDKRGVVSLLRRLLPRLRKAFPRARLLVRMDGGFGAPEILSLLDEQGVAYVVGYQKNVALLQKAKTLIEQAHRRFDSGKRGPIYGECTWAARTWKKRQRRLVIKAEVIPYHGREPKENVRFVVTNLKQSPRHVYRRVYCGRGEVENRLKELKQLGLGRTSCTSFLANQFRVLLTLSAYILMQEVRLHARGTSFARAQVWTLREKLLKVATRVRSSVRRILLHLPLDYPYRAAWQRIALSLGALPG